MATANHTPTPFSHLTTLKEVSQRKRLSTDESFMPLDVRGSGPPRPPSEFRETLAGLGFAAELPTVCQTQWPSAAGAKSCTPVEWKALQRELARKSADFRLTHGSPPSRTRNPVESGNSQPSDVWECPNAVGQGQEFPKKKLWPLR